MKQEARWLLVPLLLFAVSAGCGNAKRTVQQPAAAPPFTLADIKGKKVSLSDFKGRVVMLDFWATWCPPCRFSIPALKDLHQEFSGRGFLVLGVSVDEDISQVAPFVQEREIPYPILLAGQTNVQQQYHVTGIPAFFLIDKKGQVAQRWTGFSPRAPEEWRAAIQELLAAS
jgi:cytochrome c biogenesis protein CcmG, thiol:disulfide interchange protein DsbE